MLPRECTGICHLLVLANSTQPSLTIYVKLLAGYCHGKNDNSNKTNSRHTEIDKEILLNSLLSFTFHKFFVIHKHFFKR